MKIACLQFNPIQENTYVVWDDTLEAVVIDAGNSNPREDAALDNFIAEHGLRPVLAANTHGHFDHTLGVAHLKKRYGIPFAMSLKDAFLLDNASTSGSIFGVPVGEMPSVDTDLDTTPEIRFGHTVLRVLRTPGHTPGHTGYRLEAGDTSLLIWGDIVHFPSIQSARPEASVAFDVDPEQARRTREILLRQAASERWLIAGMHLGLPGFARVENTASGYCLRSV